MHGAASKRKGGVGNYLNGHGRQVLETGKDREA
jgi:hypothetical protein